MYTPGGHPRSSETQQRENIFPFPQTPAAPEAAAVMKAPI